MRKRRDALRRSVADDDTAEGLVARAIARLEASEGWTPEPELRRLPEVQAMISAPDELRRECVLRLAPIGVSGKYPLSYSARQLLSIVARKKLQLERADVTELLILVLDTAARSEQGPWEAADVLKSVAKHIEAAVPAWPESAQQQIAPLIEEAAAVASDHGIATRLRRLVSAEEGLPLDVIAEGDDAAERLRLVLLQSSEDQSALALALELLASYPSSGKPSRKWQASSDEVQSGLSDPRGLVGGLLTALLEAGDSEATHTLSGYAEHVQQGTYTVTYFLVESNERLACGIAMLAGKVADPVTLPLLRRLAVKSVTVIGGQFGNPRSLRLANACAQAIADVGAPASITELLALERSVRHGTLLKQIRKAIDSLAAAQGMTRDELLERAVEDHDLEADGHRQVALTRGAARIDVDGRTATLTYVDDAGVRKKSIPPDVKQADAEKIADLRVDLKAIRKTIAGERHRLDGLMTVDRRWSLRDWRGLYLDHPITGRLTRTLIWGFRGSDGVDVIGIPIDETAVVTSSGDHAAVPVDGEVRLWHPIHSSAEDVHSWRLFLLEQLIAQPFKQAFRELYVLTPAETQTRVFSNLFAGHVFGHVQARALMKGRGWSPVAVAWWDDGIDHGVARRVFEPFEVRAEFFFDPILDIEPDSTDLYPYCTSDQVRFYNASNDDPIALADVPLLVFTEAMRDVDLFVGVTSIGADPEWLDRGEGRRFERYWHDFGFGELNESARVRREVLEQLLPRLAIVDRCELEERYLVVRGDMRTYRIHLGSGNILMSPNDQYLCIVAARDRRAEKLFLPFDDDPVLSLVLSKAFLLADDRAITDETIVRQIKGS